MESTRNKLIKLLAENNSSYISGQRLSEELQISRAAIWKHMKKLEEDGYKVEGKTKKGYRIIEYPAKTSENTLHWGLQTKWLGEKIIHRASITSTQHLAHQLASEGAPHGTIVIADEQTKGKGRMNRSWYSSKHKGIWMSIIVRPEILPYMAPQLTLLAATVLADVLDAQLGVKPQIKWPNDLLINQKKTAGILTEMQAEQDQIQYIVLGMGINVNHTSDDIPDELRNKATSIYIESKQERSIKDVIQQILQAFEPAYEHYIKHGFSDTKDKWESYGFKIGQEININTMRNSWTAKFNGIASDGALLIENDDGQIKKMYSAEIDWFGEGETKC
ncbi:biotin--[acetyl-CoA-carboxylase] ligase [Virgibacillus phasianinus]|uniref:Bifunctional ligase/repressor BirA n=1 Tax=Virgibacillus phasianinus TaxID=2017483 RepID=A0A220U624_9BACI|nr:biotin--[acetyl-CoA-carboxylase] ligase [Virgibacillus phasianinus]ASK63356.1 biotin--[acetyl-CoA-carboxylase] ligase [Virgibacillus phasianinus]